MSEDTKGTRFAALIRVSTERQQKEGESLTTQRKEIQDAVNKMGGRIVDWYGGQEHATPGHEKTQVDRLLADAQKEPKLFDAVIVTHPDRWSRDNRKSAWGIEIFIETGVRFFVGEREKHFDDPQTLLELGMAAAIGQYQALNQTLTSLKNRINRAKRGIPTCGQKPYGRTFDPKTGWGIDPIKKARIEEIAKRYLAGKHLPDLAREYGMNHANLHKILTKRSGTEWLQTFDSDKLKIHEVVPTQVPRLLSEETIKAIRERAEANRTYHHGQRKNRYLFSHVIFCGHCGYALFGQTNYNGNQFYRHGPTERDRPCDRPTGKSYIGTKEIEDVVMRHLFECFGNPKGVQRIIEAATPNLAKINRDRTRVTDLLKLLERVKINRARTLGLRDKGLITEEEEDERLNAFKVEWDQYLEELNRLNNNLQNVPTPEGIRVVSAKIAAKFEKYRYTDASQKAKVRHANHALDEMTWEDQRALVETVFGGKTAEGKRMGIRIKWIDDPKRTKRGFKWKYRIDGKLMDEAGGMLPMSESRKNVMFGTNSVESALPSPDRDPRGCRSRADTAPPAV